MRNVTIRQLQIFVDAATTLSFARVAERLRLSPAAVSFQIKQIESQCGFALFERVGKRVTLTDAGRALQGYACIILQALHDADQTMMAFNGFTGGRVTIGLVSTAKYIVPHLLSRFQARYPSVDIDLKEGNRRYIIDMLMRGEIDLAIMGQPPEGADVIAEAFAAHPSVIIAPPGHPLAGLSRLPAGALASQAFVMRERGSGTRALLDEFFAGAGFSPPIAVTSGSNETIKQSVMAGMGLALISRHTISLELALGLLVILPIDGFPLMRSWFVTYRRSMPLLPLHVRLRDFIIEHGPLVIEQLDRDHAALAGRLAGVRPEAIKQQ